ncbi:hypothetical protein E2C01_044449 [Portunus trituberculatus]|uniref:Uncharacterized protein n=1 Tax=Portunus trituberculatus TaxID=210409 RepID=A0A5B7FS76_PORTR|nr:hypothetical protein [Portunus trituberculatus]
MRRPPDWPLGALRWKGATKKASRAASRTGKGRPPPATPTSTRPMLVSATGLMGLTDTPSSPYRRPRLMSSSVQAERVRDSQDHSRLPIPTRHQATDSLH